MSKIKILYTIPNFDTAGSGKVVYDLVKGLDRKIFEVEVACSSNRGAFFSEMEGLGIPILIVETTTKYRPYNSLFFRIKTIKNFLRSNNYDIVHSWHWSSDWTEVLAARWAGAKWIYTKKAMSWGNKHWKIRSYLANFIITINDEMHNYFPNKKNQKLIPLGIDTNYYNPDLFPEKLGANDTFNIITVANLVPVKGIEVLIKAIKRLDDSSIKLTVLGDNTNEYGQYLISVCKQLNIEGQVNFLGKKTDVRPYIAASDLYVIPTLNEGRKEGMPMALVEAMSMGTPVLGSDISGINFVLKHFKNLLCKAGSESNLANEILKIKALTIQERIHLGNELRTYVIENFNYDIFIAEHQKLYKRIID
ncbi:glycosyltransferase family 4 protein [Aequorivita antarctica]|uniref:Glycosyltransferase family 4 protein n=1 Tax=Aequorivita antarctica TaxID=153266 RepID=A0A5C6YXR7_9FLAO|nr:glycosyltransferase family 4 protein [Aequorivita antarctica]TXD72484.1 glycosyltransferase family 4 protein [Aequorivita antarctica]SRX75618.1 N-acetyl-alpha-D-glucosaminyl L-malate synthase [Aequorivita antarctica]